MALTFVFVMACLAFGANGKGLYQKLAVPICDAQQEACNYCVETVAFLSGTIDDDGFESALVTFGVAICDLLDDTTPAYKECVDYIKSGPARAKKISASVLGDPKGLCSFVCTASNQTVNTKCQPKAPSRYDCSVKAADTTDACNICQSVPLFAKQLLTDDGFLGVLEKFLLTDCDLIAPGCEKDSCVDHTEFLSTKIKFFVGEFLNPKASCGFVCTQ